MEEELQKMIKFAAITFSHFILFLKYCMQIFEFFSLICPWANSYSLVINYFFNGIVNLEVMLEIL